jgi:drug/metabolite transporter (DMT)-like permease
VRFWEKPTPWQVGAILILGVFAVSSAAIFIRLAIDAAQTRGVGFSLFLGASRLILASLMLLPAWRQPSPTPIEYRAFYYAMAAGLCLAIHFAAWITSLSFTSIAASTSLVTTNPIWVAVLSWLWFKETPRKTTIVGIAIALLGGVGIAWGSADVSTSGSNPLVGNLLALIGAWMASLYLLFGREAQNRGCGTSRYVAIAYTTAALILLPLPWLSGAGYTGYPAAVYFYLFLMALISQIIGHTSVNWAMRWLSPTLVTLAILFEPVGASFLGLMIFGEIPNGAVLVGALVLLCGVAIAILGMRDRAAQRQS